MQATRFECDPSGYETCDWLRTYLEELRLRALLCDGTLWWVPPYLLRKRQHPASTDPKVRIICLQKKKEHKKLRRICPTLTLVDR